MSTPGMKARCGVQAKVNNEKNHFMTRVLVYCNISTLEIDLLVDFFIFFIGIIFITRTFIVKFFKNGSYQYEQSGNGIRSSFTELRTKAVLYYVYTKHTAKKCISFLGFRSILGKFWFLEIIFTEKLPILCQYRSLPQPPPP